MCIINYLEGGGMDETTQLTQFNIFGIRNTKFDFYPPGTKVSIFQPHNPSALAKAPGAIQCTVVGNMLLKIIIYA